MKNVIPIMLQPESEQAFYVKSIFAGMRQSAEKLGYELEFVKNPDTLKRFSDIGYKSVVIIGYVIDWLEKSIDTAIKAGFKPMAVNTWLSPEILACCDGVYCQLRESVEYAVRYLAAANRRGIALFGTNGLSLADRLKEEVFGACFMEYRNISSMIVRGGNPINECTDNFISRLSAGTVDAVICANDTVAIYLIDRLTEYGYRVPEDIYVIGMGNSKLGQKINIPLSSVDFNYEELGKQAVVLWRYIHKDGGENHFESSVPCRFIARKSTSYFELNETIPVFARTRRMATTVRTNTDEYYEDKNVRTIINIEEFLCSCDDLDYKILESITNGVSDTIMTEQLNISDRAIRYRINKMAKKLGFSSRDEIVRQFEKLRAFGLGTVTND